LFHCSSDGSADRTWQIQRNSTGEPHFNSACSEKRERATMQPGGTILPYCRRKKTGVLKARKSRRFDRNGRNPAETLYLGLLHHHAQGNKPSRKGHVIGSQCSHYDILSIRETMLPISLLTNSPRRASLEAANPWPLEAISLGKE